MNDILEKPHTIFAIELPAPPQDETSVVIYFVSALALGLCVLYWFWLRYGSAKGRAVKQINALSSRLRNQSLYSEMMDNEVQFSHQLAYEISNIFRKAVLLPRLTATTPLPAELQKYQKRWLSFIGSMDQVRYSSVVLEQKEQQRLLSDARFFVKRWP